MAHVEAIPDHIESLLADCERNRARLVENMGKGRHVDEGIKHLKDLATASVQLSREARAWAKEKQALGKSLTLDEQIELTAKFVENLNRVQRAQLFLLIDRFRVY